MTSENRKWRRMARIGGYIDSIDNLIKTLRGWKKRYVKERDKLCEEVLE